MTTHDWPSLWMALAVGVAALVFFWWRRYSRHFARRGVPSTQPLPLLGDMLALVLNQKSIADISDELYHKLSPHPYAGITSFTLPIYLIRDPELIRAVTVKDFDHFTDHINFATSDKGNPLVRRMLFSLKGKEWHDMRSTLSPAFTSMKMKNMFVFMSEIGQQMVEHLKNETAKLGGSCGNGGVLTLELRDFFRRVTNDVIATTAFGVKVDSLSEPNNAFYTMGRDLTNVRPIVAFGYFVSPELMEFLGIPFFDSKTVQYFKTILRETIKAREEQGIVRHDMIDLLMQARRGELTSEETEKNGVIEDKRFRFTDDDVEAQALLFFFGGFETVSTVLTFCCYLLATNEDVQERLQCEVDKIMKTTCGKPDYEQVMGCQYLDMVISESLRMYAPAPFLDRECTRPYRLPATDTCPGVELRPGEAIWVPVHAIHHDANYFPNPERFDPERFSPENKHNIKPFTFYPFGAGPRFCIAQRFALMEVKIILMYLMSQFSIQVVPKTPVPLKLDPSNNISVSIKGGAWLGIRSRS